MTPRTKLVSIAGITWTAIFAFAFIAAPHSCEWGASAYFLTGVAGFLGLFMAPIVVHTDRTMLRRMLPGLGFAAVTLIVWTAGLFIANVRILCRLF